MNQGLLVGGVVEDVVHDDADVAALGFRGHVLEVGHGAVLRIDGCVVGDVVAEVDLGRGVHGGDPDGVDAELLDVVEARGDAFDVADAVAVGVLKAAGVDLVDDGVLPPGVGSCVFLVDGRWDLSGGLRERAWQQATERESCAEEMVRKS